MSMEISLTSALIKLYDQGYAKYPTLMKILTIVLGVGLLGSSYFIIKETNAKQEG